MLNFSQWRLLLVGAACLTISYASAMAETFNIPAGSLEAALTAYTQQTGVALMVSSQAVGNARTHGVKGDLSPEAALSRLLNGTGFKAETHSEGSIAIVRDAHAADDTASVHIAAANAAPSAPGAALETVTVTSSKIGGDVQNIPISITALSQEQLTATQTAGGPDLIKQVPNMTFSKTNFTGYNIEIRGIGTQAISVTTDPAVAVAMNDTPFLRNHFFEQEFYDLSQVEVLRGPQGTLYGRNATAGVVNVITAKPTDQFEAMASADIGNYQNRRLEGMLNVPIVDDRLDFRIAGEWTKRDGYSFNELNDQSIDGRDLWSSRATIGWKALSNVQSYLVWEHFSEDDNRLRSGKQLCKTDFGPGSIDGHAKPMGYIGAQGQYEPYGGPGNFFTQGCKGGSLYSPDAFGAPLGYALPYVLGATDLGITLPINPYASTVQSTNLRHIESSINPSYQAKNDTVEWNTDWQANPALTFTSATGYNNDYLWSAEDFNRFSAAPGLFHYYTPAQGGHEGVLPDPSGLQICAGGDCGSGVSVGLPCTTGADCTPAGYFCDPQLGCSDRLIVEDVSTERAWQLSQEFRLSSNFSGPLNFSAGANYLHYETLEKYYVFSNAFTLISGGFVPGEFDSNNGDGPLPNGYQYNVPGQQLRVDRGYVDPNPLSSLNDQGHNYFLSKNPYVLNSYAAFGEANYNIFSDLKLTAGLRWTDDQKHFLEIPSWVATQGYGYPIVGVLNQQWDQWTGRAVANWTPKLSFTDQTLIYGSYSHGYKAGGANPPGAEFTADFNSTHTDPVHPLTFKPEFIEAFELGTKNTLLDGAITLNGDVFYYNYTGYQISEIVDRTAINTNYDAHIKGAEIESSWEPLPGLKFGLTGGFEASNIAKGTEAVDLMDRTAGHPGWYVVKPFATEASNCIFPAYVAAWIDFGAPEVSGDAVSYCSLAYQFHLDPFTLLPYKANPPVDSDGNPPHGFCTGGLNPDCVIPNYAGYDPLAGTPGDPYTGQNTANGVDYGPVPNNGQGFSKNLSGHQLPNAPQFTTSLTAEYTTPVTEDWAATLHGDFYWQSQSWARVFDDPIDKIHGYANVNAALILTNQNGWQVMGYAKNIFNVTAITGTFLNSDDTGLTTNVFLTDPRLVGVRVTKNW